MRDAKSAWRSGLIILVPLDACFEVFRSASRLSFPRPTSRDLSRIFVLIPTHVKFKFEFKFNF